MPKKRREKPLKGRQPEASQGRAIAAVAPDSGRESNNQDQGRKADAPKRILKKETGPAQTAVEPVPKDQDPRRQQAKTKEVSPFGQNPPFLSSLQGSGLPKLAKAVRLQALQGVSCFPSLLTECSWHQYTSQSLWGLSQAVVSASVWCTGIRFAVKRVKAAQGGESQRRQSSKPVRAGFQPYTPKSRSGGQS